MTLIRLCFIHCILIMFVIACVHVGNSFQPVCVGVWKQRWNNVGGEPGERYISPESALAPPSLSLRVDFDFPSSLSWP